MIIFLGAAEFYSGNLSGGSCLLNGSRLIGGFRHRLGRAGRNSVENLCHTTYRATKSWEGSYEPEVSAETRYRSCGGLLFALPHVASAEQSNIQSATLGQNQKTAEVSTEELRRILMDGSATVFDARPFMEFASGHIPGAVNVSANAGMPMSLFVSDVAEIERVLNGNKGGAIACMQWPVLWEEQPSGRRTHPSWLHEYPSLSVGRPSLAGTRWGDGDRAGGFQYVREGDHTARTGMIASGGGVCRWDTVGSNPLADG